MWRPSRDVRACEKVHWGQCEIWHNIIITVTVLGILLEACSVSIAGWVSWGCSAVGDLIQNEL